MQIVLINIMKTDKMLTLYFNFILQRLPVIDVIVDWLLLPEQPGDMSWQNIDIPWNGLEEYNTLFYVIRINKCHLTHVPLNSNRFYNFPSINNNQPSGVL